MGRGAQRSGMEGTGTASDAAEGERSSDENTSSKEAASVGVVLPEEQLTSPLDMSGTPFENGQLVECQKCQKRMLAPQRSPFLRCFHCNSIVRPETPAEQAARNRPSTEAPRRTQLARAKAKSKSAARTRQPLPHETTLHLETVFQRVKAAEVTVHHVFTELSLSVCCAAAHTSWSRVPRHRMIPNNKAAISRCRYLIHPSSACL